jgi:hypothetical protein
MIDASDDLPISRQARALGISPGSVYFRARPASCVDVVLIRRIDELHRANRSPAAGCCANFSQAAGSASVACTSQR